MGCFLIAAVRVAVVEPAEQTYSDAVCSFLLAAATGDHERTQSLTETQIHDLTVLETKGAKSVSPG